jgi:small subunit ribosomal protein S18
MADQPNNVNNNQAPASQPEASSAGGNQGAGAQGAGSQGAGNTGGPRYGGGGGGGPRYGGGGGGGPRYGGGGGGGPRYGGGRSQGGGGRPGGRPRSRDRYVPRRKVCGFCVDKIEYIDYKDVPRLRKYLSERAKIEPRRKTGTCARHQRALSVALKRARHMALLPFVGPHSR